MLTFLEPAAFETGCRDFFESYQGDLGFTRCASVACFTLTLKLRRFFVIASLRPIVVQRAVVARPNSFARSAYFFYWDLCHLS